MSEVIINKTRYECPPAVAAYIKELTTENARLEELHQKAKQLLKAAVEDIHELLCDKKNLDGNEQSCNICSYIDWCPCCKECTIREDLRNWRYADEVLKIQWSKENPLIIKGGKVEVTLVDYEPSKSCTNSLAISTCLKCGKCGRTFHAGKLTNDAEQALDNFAYKGLTIRQWADKITAGEYQPVKHGGTENLWVSCNERMPETLTETLDGWYSECCLVFAEETEWMGMAYYRTNDNKSWWEFADAQNKPKIDWAEITHWMPLPNHPNCGAKMDRGAEK